MNLLFSCIGKRGYIARLFRPHLPLGSRIIGTSNSRWTSGFHSCDQNYLMPDISSANYIPQVLDICRKERIDGLLSFFDMDVHRLGAHRDEFQSLGVKCFIPAYEAADTCFDKLKTFHFLTRHGFATPKTYSALAEARQALGVGELRYPVYVKPRYGFGSRNTFQARNDKELEVFFGIEADMLIQETLGGDAYDFDILNDLQGRALSVIPWRKSLSKMGETEQAETVENQQLIDTGVRLATTLGHYGPLDADLFIWEDRIYVLEINLRFGGGYPVSHMAGAEFPAMIVQMTKGETLSPRLGDYQRGVVMMKELHILGGNSEAFFEDTLHLPASSRK